jgi:hypothetical protein
LVVGLALEGGVLERLGVELLRHLRDSQHAGSEEDGERGAQGSIDKTLGVRFLVHEATRA